MLTAFISDLHLSPDDPDITHRFEAFLQWASKNISALYILGDFFHAWAGDDSQNSWSLSIAAKLKHLNEQGIKLYFMSGNRDFLVGKLFCQQAGLIRLEDPNICTLGTHRILLSHGDKFCTNDRSHQWLIAVTRNCFFINLFLKLPLTLRLKIVSSARKASRSKLYDPVRMQVTKHSVLQSMTINQADVLIHGHTHQPKHIIYQLEQAKKDHYILSDWDDIAKILCYDVSKGFYFRQF